LSIDLVNRRLLIAFRAVMRTLRRIATVGLLALIPAAPAAGQTPAWKPATDGPVGNATTSSCPEGTAVTFRAVERLYMTDDQGRGSFTGGNNYATAAITQLFADQVGRDSACQIGVSVDIVAMGATPWPSSLTSAGDLAGGMPSDIGSLLRSGPYDFAIMRYPRTGPEAYSGLTIGELGFILPTTTTMGYVDVMMHEFMHVMTFKYRPAQGWPTPDVHGACEHGYATGPLGSDMCTSGNERYFTDMLQGRVIENGVPRGLLPSDIAAQPPASVAAAAKQKADADAALARCKQLWPLIDQLRDQRDKLAAVKHRTASQRRKLATLRRQIKSLLPDVTACDPLWPAASGGR
jgi:hypothetical protein